MFDVFGGAIYSMHFYSKGELVKAVTSLMSEYPGHDHNFKVAMDGLTLHASPEAFECLFAAAKAEVVANGQPG